MAETVIRLDDDILDAINQAADAIGLPTYPPREPGEFTGEEFSCQRGSGHRQAMSYLLTAVRNGTLKRRPWINESGKRCYLYCVKKKPETGA